MPTRAPSNTALKKPDAPRDIKPLAVEAPIMTAAIVANRNNDTRMTLLTSTAGFLLNTTGHIDKEAKNDNATKTSGVSDKSGRFDDLIITIGVVTQKSKITRTKCL